MTTLLALPAQNNFGDTVPDGVAGPVGLFITVLLVIATVLLVRNMNARLRRLPESFPPPAAPASPADQRRTGSDPAPGGDTSPAEQVPPS
jgi:hypothetical protein